MRLILQSELKFSSRAACDRPVRWGLVALSCELDTLAADVIAGSREISSFEDGGRELERGKGGGKLDRCEEGGALFVMLLSACCGDFWAVSYRAKFQKAFLNQPGETRGHQGSVSGSSTSTISSMFDNSPTGLDRIPKALQNPRMPVLHADQVRLHPQILQV